MIVSLVGRDAVIALADGTILSPGRQVDVSALRGAVAVSPRRTVIELTRRVQGLAASEALWTANFPLEPYAVRLMRRSQRCPDQDDLVELDFIGDWRLPIRISRYRHEQIGRNGCVVRWRRPSASSGVLPVARMIFDPRHEHALEPEGEGAWRLPGRCKGTCLVYLRDGLDVVSRPVPVAQPGSPDAYAGLWFQPWRYPTTRNASAPSVTHWPGFAGGQARADDLGGYSTPRPI